MDLRPGPFISKEINSLLSCYREMHLKIICQENLLITVVLQFNSEASHSSLGIYLQAHDQIKVSATLFFENPSRQNQSYFSNSANPWQWSPSDQSRFSRAGLQ